MAERPSIELSPKALQEMDDHGNIMKIVMHAHYEDGHEYAWNIQLRRSDGRPRFLFRVTPYGTITAEEEDGND